MQINLDKNFLKNFHKHFFKNRFTFPPIKELEICLVYQDKYFNLYKIVKNALNKIDSLSLNKIVGENEMDIEVSDITIKLIEKENLNYEIL